MDVDKGHVAYAVLARVRSIDDAHDQDRQDETKGARLSAVCPPLLSLEPNHQKFKCHGQRGGIQRASSVYQQTSFRAPDGRLAYKHEAPASRTSTKRKRVNRSCDVEDLVEYKPEAQASELPYAPVRSCASMTYTIADSRSSSWLIQRPLPPPRSVLLSPAKERAPARNQTAKSKKIEILFHPRQARKSGVARRQPQLLFYLHRARSFTRKRYNESVPRARKSSGLGSPCPGKGTHPAVA